MALRWRSVHAGDESIDAAPPRRPAGARWAGLLETGAWIAAAWPLFFAVLLHACWLHAWVLLGHRPRPYLDDPKYIPGLGGWGWPTSLACLGILPAGLALVGLLPLRLGAAAPPRRHARVRCGASLLLYVGVMAALRADPWAVFDWWLD